MFFQAQKVRLETLPEYLKERRQYLKLSLAEVAKQAGINAKALKALETGDYKSLPPEVYVKGFLAQLAGLYSADKDALIAQYELERSIQLNVSREFFGGRRSWQPKWLRNLIVTPRTLSFFGAAIFVGAAVIYFVWQVLAISQPPFLVVNEPKDFSVQETALALVSGQSEPGVVVTVNEEPVFVDREGRFETRVGISSGMKEIVIVARNRFGKISSKTVTVIGPQP